MERLSGRALLRESLRGRGPEVALFAFWSLVEAVPAALSGRLIAWALDRGFLTGHTDRGLAFLGLFGLAVLAGTWGTRQAYLRLAVVIEPFRDELVRRAVHGALRRSAASGLPGEGAAVARLTQQVEIAREAYASVLMAAQGFLVTAGAAIAGLVVLLPAAVPLVLAPLAGTVVVLALSVRRLARRQHDVIVADEELGAAGAAIVGGLRDVAAAGGEDVAEQAVGWRVAHQARATARLARMTALRTLAVAIGGWLPIVLILTRSDWLLRHGASTGAIIGALTYVLRGVQPALQQLAGGLGGTGVWLLVTLRRIAEATALEEPARRAPRARAVRDATLELDRVTFAYGRAAAPVVADLTLTVPDGEHVAIVGPSGVGKSTLANLMAGMLAPQAGAVRIGGCPVAALNAAGLAGARVLVPQEAYVLRATLRENLAYLRHDVPSRELAGAIERLGAGPLLARLGGLEAVVDPGELSSGERQLLTLVRAYLSPARLVILDEAGSHLDPACEARAESAFAQRPGSVIVIAHRISSARRADRVLVLDGVEAVAGAHAELLTASPLYRDLVGTWDAGVPASIGVARSRSPG